MRIDKDKVKEIILTDEIYLTFNFAFPGKIKAWPSIIGSIAKTDYLEYVPLNYCTIDITMDDDHIVGHAECSECKRNIEAWVNYCPYCGAKVRGKHVKEPTVVTETIHMDILDLNEENSDAE